MTMERREILVLGASYGLLIGTRLALAGHAVTLVARLSEVTRFRSNGLSVELAVKEGDETIHIGQDDLPQAMSFATPEEAVACRFDLAFLALAEPQYRAPEIASLLEALTKAGTPSVSIMNMPPSPFLARLPGISVDAMRPAFAALEAWNKLDPQLLTAASPDPQAVRLNPECPERLTVTLPTNFKIAPFANPSHQEMLEAVASSVDASRVFRDGREVTPRVRLIASKSLYVPLAKWPMLIAGNCRCVQEGAARSIKEAVWDNVVESQVIYEDVLALCRYLGAPMGDLVPFEKYSLAAKSLSLPSSLARGLHSGATAVERVDMLVAALSVEAGTSIRGLSSITNLIDVMLHANRRL